jgi:thioredoxin-dependent peroxiredoxin
MLKAGDPAPEFALKDADGKTWRLSEMKGQKIVLYFYPADDTPGCTRESCDFRDSRADFDKAGYTILGVSPQGAASKVRFTDKYSLNFPLLIDDELAATRAYGAYKELGDYEGIPLKVKRSTFVIDEDGLIVEALYGVTAKGHVETLKEQIGV